jgi:hypothetical protein
MSSFKLQPFPTDSPIPQIDISGQIDRSGNFLSIEYLLQGNLSNVAIDPPAHLPARKLELWTSTCFEFFIGVAGSPNYWEFNLAPTGDWNVYALDDYRQGLRPEISFGSLPFRIDRLVNSLRLNLAFDLSKIIKTDLKLEVAVTTVIKSNQDKISYWALTHAGTEADFHRRDSFTISL